MKNSTNVIDEEKNEANSNNKQEISNFERIKQESLIQILLDGNLELLKQFSFKDIKNEKFLLEILDTDNIRLKIPEQTSENDNIKNLDALTVALVKGHLEIVQYLLEQGADTESITANTCLGSMTTGLHIAAENGYLKLVLYLLDQGIEIDIRDSEEMTAMQAAATAGHLEVVQCLLDRKTDINAKALEGITALHLAANSGHLKIVQCLLDHKAEVNTKNNQGLTALHLAAGSGHSEIVQSLLDHKANVNAKGFQGVTALYCAAATGHSEIVQSLLDYKANMNTKFFGDITAFHVAAGKGHLGVVQCLLNHSLNRKADVNAESLEGFIAKIYKYFVKEDTAINVNDLVNGETALHCAARHGHLEVVQYLLENGADIKAVSSKGLNTLCIAASEGHLKIVKFLLQQGELLKEIPSSYSQDIQVLLKVALLVHKLYNLETINSEDITCLAPASAMNDEKDLGIDLFKLFLLNRGLYKALGEYSQFFQENISKFKDNVQLFHFFSKLITEVNKFESNFIQDALNIIIMTEGIELSSFNKINTSASWGNKYSLQALECLERNLGEDEKKVSANVLIKLKKIAQSIKEEENITSQSQELVIEETEITEEEGIIFHKSVICFINNYFINMTTEFLENHLFDHTILIQQLELLLAAPLPHKIKELITNNILPYAQIKKESAVSLDSEENKESCSDSQLEYIEHAKADTPTIGDTESP